MESESIKALVLSLPEMAAWPEIPGLFDRAGDVPRPDWLLPIKACQAVGGSENDAAPVAAAVACLQLSIMLVDDILDDDPRGVHIERGSGWTANLALALQTASIQLLARIKPCDHLHWSLSEEISRTSLATAAGQNLDIQNLSSEEDYWAVVAAKSTPFYGSALRLGGLVGGASPDTLARLYRLGVIIGEIIQIEDDLEDAFQVPANADWIEGRNNLLILYARSAEHDRKERFEDLLSAIDFPDCLEEAQRILITSGATGYCAFLLVQRYRQARALLNEMNLLKPEPLETILEDYADSLLSFLQISGLEVSRSLLTNS